MFCSYSRRKLKKVSMTLRDKREIPSLKIDKMEDKKKDPEEQVYLVCLVYVHF